jgi:hypothetical protein
LPHEKKCPKELIGCDKKSFLVWKLYDCRHNKKSAQKNKQWLIFTTGKNGSEEQGDQGPMF